MPGISDVEGATGGRVMSHRFDPGRKGSWVRILIGAGATATVISLFWFGPALSAPLAQMSHAGHALTAAGASAPHAGTIAHNLNQLLMAMKL